jgi:tetratricopeptide (TPR) repeat protein
MYKTHFDENLRDIPDNAEATRQEVAQLKEKLPLTLAPLERTRLLCDIGTGLRLLGDLEEAKNHLKEAVDLCETFQLDIKTTVRAQILLAHVLQWQGNFLKSNRLFGELIITVEADIGASSLKAFVYQHAGKNLFDQKMYPHALKFFEKALKLRESEKAPEDQIESTRLAIHATRAKIES